MSTVPSFLVSLSTITTPTVQGVWTMNAYQQERVILKAVHGSPQANFRGIFCLGNFIK